LTLTVHAPLSGDDASPLILQTDGIKVRQILLNLLGNAVKYSEHGGITLTVRERSDVAVFEVHDTGIGIPPEHLEQIFDPFWQVQQTATRTAGGAGLGLSVSRERLPGDGVSRTAFASPRHAASSTAASDVGARLGVSDCIGMFRDGADPCADPRVASSCECVPSTGLLGGGGRP
jgi:signal transduction histidine kinase